MEELQKANKPILKKDFSLTLSIWHWTNLVILASILITVLLAKTIFNSKDNSSLIQTALEKKGVVVTLEQAKIIAKLYTHKLWDWHVYFGYVLTGLFLFRLALEYFQLAEQKFLTTLNKARTYLKHKPEEKRETKHFLIVKFIYTLFYLDLALMVFTGLFIEFTDNYPNLKSIRSLIKDIHNVGMYVMLGFIASHLAGLLLFEIKKKIHSTS